MGVGLEKLGDLPKAAGLVKSKIGLAKQPRDVVCPMMTPDGGHKSTEAG